jgi:hypothetical protein
VVERLLGRYLRELGTRAAAERPARGREHEALHRLRRAPLEALEERRMLAVDGKEPSPTPLPGARCEVASRHEALFIGEREVDPGLERGERRRQAGEADDGIQDDVRLGRADERVERGIAVDRHMPDAPDLCDLAGLVSP